ncbi:MAG TPA: hypothetical protein VM243_12910 [Phycisphaerae bacterium]|nr:hypothetical protein [Phycisphaerae bacterium]
MDTPPAERVALIVPTWDAVSTASYRSHMQLVGYMTAHLPAGGFLFACTERKPIPFACSHLVDIALVQEADWILYIDDDVSPPQDVYFQLREHADPVNRPIVSALGFFRAPPFWPSIFKYQGWPTVPNPSIAKPMPLWDYPENELIQVDATGFCCLLIHKSVFEKIGKPWFDQTDDYSPDGFFMMRCWKKGIPIYCHTGVQVDHHFQAAANGKMFRAWCAANGGTEAAERMAVEYFRIGKTFQDVTGKGELIPPKKGVDQKKLAQQIAEGKGNGVRNNYQLLA